MTDCKLGVRVSSHPSRVPAVVEALRAKGFEVGHDARFDIPDQTVPGHVNAYLYLHMPEACVCRPPADMPCVGCGRTVLEWCQFWGDGGDGPYHLVCRPCRRRLGNWLRGSREVS